MRKSAPPKPAVKRWRVIEIAKTGRHIADLPAPNAEAAIQRAIELYGITDPRRQRRLVAQPME